MASACTPACECAGRAGRPTPVFLPCLAEGTLRAAGLGAPRPDARLPPRSPRPLVAGLTASSRPSARRATSACTAVRLGQGPAWVAPSAASEGPGRRGGRRAGRQGRATSLGWVCEWTGPGGLAAPELGAGGVRRWGGIRGAGSSQHRLFLALVPTPHSLPAPSTGGHRVARWLLLPPRAGPHLCRSGVGAGRGGAGLQSSLGSPSLDLPPPCAALSPRHLEGLAPASPRSDPRRAGHPPSPAPSRGAPRCREHLLSSGRPTWRECEGHEDRARRVPGGGEAPCPSLGPAPAWHRCG